jgi:hypothetical protein
MQHLTGKLRRRMPAMAEDQIVCDLLNFLTRRTDAEPRR